ncbi:hypothetical protein [Caulobacter sp. RL271]|uniref:Uncharacterized protein n=1 Tax=Caulobacter segnis TaxID=88688 RepID=A0ABY4ZR92_9CAUL|nr:hypothetical protein [Caulobacter segnis]USQ95327.1 hypothetical protein MZV50_22695 [Caulobacter segnis]
MGETANTEGRKDNAALPPGDRPGLVSAKDTVKTGKAEQRSAGPDGPDAAEVGDTFKQPKP